MWLVEIILEPISIKSNPVSILPWSMGRVLAWMAYHEYAPVSRRVYECEKAMLDSLPQSTISVNCHNQGDQQLVYTKMNQT